MTSTRVRRAAADEAAETPKKPPIRRECEVEIDGDDFVRALKAIVPHAGEQEDVPRFCRIRVQLAGKEMTLSAGDGFSVGLYRLQPYDVVEEPVQFDLRVKDVGHLVRIYKPIKDMTTTLRIAVSRGGRVRVQRVGQLEGLAEGEAFEAMPYLAGEEDMPTYGANLNLLLSAEDAEPAPVTSIKPTALQAMAATAGVLGYSIEVEATRENGPLLARIGPDFIGLMATWHDPDRERTAKARADARALWQQRLPAPTEANLRRQRRAVDLQTASGVLTVEDLDSEMQPRLDFANAEGRALLGQCAELVIAAQYASRAMLTRKARLPLADAADVLAELTKLGIVADEEDPATPNRDVLFRAERAGEVALCLIHGEADLPPTAAQDDARDDEQRRRDLAGAGESDQPVPGTDPAAGTAVEFRAP